MRKGSFVGAVAMAASLLLATPAMADTVSEDFNIANESPLTAATATANGWTYIGGNQYDVAIDQNALRVSNRDQSGSFGDWFFSDQLATPATENGEQTFTAEFDISSTTPGVEQEGLQVSVSPQTTGGARMSFLKFEDTDGGIDVSFADVANNGTDFRLVKIADNLSRGGFHVKIVLDLYPGPHNDVAQVFITGGGAPSGPLVPASGSGFDGFYAPVDHPDTVNKAKAGQTIPLKFKVDAEPATTWEDYYRFNGESNAGIDPQDWTTRQVDSLIVQARGAENVDNPGVAGKGFRIDNVVISSTDTLALPTFAAVGDPAIFGTNPFTADSVACELGADIDPIEVYAPGQSGLTYNEATGVWHYNWQTPKAIAKSCVQMTLNLTGDYALFKFTK